MELDTVERFFKYTDVEGARFALRDGTLKFSAASEFNDPFDAAIDALYGYDSIATLQELNEESARILLSDEPMPPFAKNREAQLKGWMRECLANKSPEVKAELKDLLLADGPEAIWNIERLRQVESESLAFVKFTFATDAIFCASQNCDNHLLWAHYSQDHKGAVLEFAPNVEKDSIFRMLTKVMYSPDRPVLYKSPRDFMEKGMFREHMDVLNEYMHSVSFTKNPQWEYEQEVRCLKPLTLVPGRKFCLHNYHDDELRAVYLGCKIDESVAKEFVQLAVARNPDIKIFKMQKDSASYKLTPDSVDASAFL